LGLFSCYIKIFRDDNVTFDFNHSCVSLVTFEFFVLGFTEDEEGVCLR